MSNEPAPQRRYHFTTSKRQAELAFAALEQAFEDDGCPVALREVDEDADVHEISLYAFGDPAQMDARLREALPAALRAARIDVEDVPDVDWVAASLDGLKPVRAGRFLVHGRHDRPRIRANDLSIEIEAGLAFGTGHHGTTAGCLDMLGRVLRRERPGSVLDLGTGSGVLAIAAAKAARIPVLATDIDPVATRVAEANVRLNGVGAFVATATATGFSHPRIAAGAPYDLIIANILARPLMKLAPAMAAHVAPGASIILSGILARQRNAVVAAFVGSHFRHVRTLPREGWVTIWMKR